MTTAYQAVCQADDLIRQAHHKFNPSQYCTRSDWAKTKHGGELCITDHKSKSCDENDYKQLPKLPRGGNQALSACEMINRMIKLTPTPPHLTDETCPLFCDNNGRSRD